MFRILITLRALKRTKSIWLQVLKVSKTMAAILLPVHRWRIRNFQSSKARHFAQVKDGDIKLEQLTNCATLTRNESCTAKRFRFEGWMHDLRYLCLFYAFRLESGGGSSFLYAARIKYTHNSNMQYLSVIISFSSHVKIWRGLHTYKIPLVIVGADKKERKYKLTHEGCRSYNIMNNECTKNLECIQKCFSLEIVVSFIG